MKLIVVITLITEYVTRLNDMSSHAVGMDVLVVMMITDASTSLNELGCDPKLIQIVLLPHGVLFEHL